MAKMQKLDSKQVPQVIILGVISVGVLGYAAMTFFGGTNPTPVAGTKTEARTQLAKATSEGTAATSPTDPAVGAPALGNVPGLNAPGLQLPGQYNPDPFRAGAEEKKPGTPKPAAPKAEVKVAQAAPRPGPSLPSVDEFPGMRRFQGLPSVAPPAPPVKTGPTRPTLSVTGIISAEDGKDMALIEMGSDHRIIQQGDMLPNRYRVTHIAADGVMLVNGSDRYFVALGLKGKPAITPDGAGIPAKG